MEIVFKLFIFVVFVVCFDREELKALAEDNKKMGEEHKNHKEYLNKVVYRNKPTAAYFDQFNKSTR